MTAFLFATKRSGDNKIREVRMEKCRLQNLLFVGEQKEASIVRLLACR